MRVLGVDPGLGRVGYGVVERSGGAVCHVTHGVITTEKGSPLPVRLRLIHAELSQMIAELRPSCIATEALFFASNRATAMDVGKSLGVVMLAAAQSELAWAEYKPAEVKQTVTGSGNADKRQVAYMVTRLLNLSKAPKPDDAADALAIAICHAITGRLRSL